MVYVLTFSILPKSYGVAVIVALTRLVPLFPFNLLNYGFGLTKVRFLTYVFWSWLCMLPGTILYIVGFDVVLKGLTDNKAPWLLIAIFLIAASGVYLLARFAKKRLNKSGNDPAYYSCSQRISTTKSTKDTKKILIENQEDDE